MKHKLVTIFALIFTGHMAHAGTVAAVTLTLQEGERKPVVATTTVDLEDRATLPLLLSDRRVWICELNAKTAGGHLQDSIYVSLSDRSRPVVAEAGVQSVTLFAGQIRGDFKSGDKVVVFCSGDTTVEMEIRPETGAGEGSAVREPASAAAPELRAEGGDESKQESEAQSPSPEDG